MAVRCAAGPVTTNLEKPLRFPKLRTMMNFKLNWKRPLFYVLLPIFFVMIFLGFPLPVLPPPEAKAKQKQSIPAKEQKKRIQL